MKAKIKTFKKHIWFTLALWMQILQSIIEVNSTQLLFETFINQILDSNTANQFCFSRKLQFGCKNLDLGFQKKLLILQRVLDKKMTAD